MRMMNELPLAGEAHTDLSAQCVVIIVSYMDSPYGKPFVMDFRTLNSELRALSHIDSYIL